MEHNPVRVRGVRLGGWRMRRLAPLLGPFDQGLSSLTNFIPAVVVARSSGVAEFADVSLALVAVNLGLGVIRSLMGEVALAEVSAGSRIAEVGDDRSSTGSALVLAAAVAMVMLGAAASMDGRDLFGHPLALAALAVPLVTFQDHLRYVAFARARPEIACASDAAWLVVLAVVTVVALHDASWAAVLAGWAVTSLVGTVAASVLLRVVPRFGGLRPWLRATGHRGGRFTLEYLSVFGASSMALILIGSIGEATDLGAVRGLQLLASPALILLSGFGMSLPAALAPRLTEGRVMATVHVVAAVLAGVAVLACVPLLVLPGAAGRWLLGETWLVVSGLRWWAVPYVVFGAVTTVFRIGVRASRAESRSTGYQLSLMPVVIALPPLAAVTGGPAWCMAAVVLTTGLSSFAWYVAARRGPRPTATS